MLILIFIDIVLFFIIIIFVMANIIIIDYFIKNLLYAYKIPRKNATGLDSWKYLYF